MSFAQVKEVLRGLRDQGWGVEQTTNGDRYKATPPERGRQIVYFSARLTDATPALRALREQGFVWPPPAPPKPPPEPVIRATPFPAKPHPFVSTEKQGPEPPPPASAVRPSAGSAELAFLELRDAKEYERLAAGELQAKRKAVEQANADLEMAGAAYEEAVGALADKRRAFDRAFESEVAGEAARAMGGRS